MRVGLYRVSQGDEVDVASAQFFVNSSLSPELLLRRRSKTAADVLEGVRQNWFTQSRWDALYRNWGAVCRQGPCGPQRSFEPWVHWIPPSRFALAWVILGVGMGSLRDAHFVRSLLWPCTFLVQALGSYARYQGVH